jgi:uncharacterized protein YjbI with pentapeptide repeats
MANEKHRKVLNQGVSRWNIWREENKDVKVDLSKADLSKADLSKADLSKADLRLALLHEADLREAYLSKADLRLARLHGAQMNRADLSGADLTGARLREVNLSGADLRGARLHKADLTGGNLRWADLSGADLSGADLSGVNLSEVDLSGVDLSEARLHGVRLHGAQMNRADLSGADLTRVTLVRTILLNANLSSCRIFGISAWKLDLDQTIQSDLTISDYDEPLITVDNLEIAQFLYLLINNEKLRDVIDTIGKKAVLILGRFTPERKIVLDALREELRKRNYIPILFDFEKPGSRNLTETVRTLAHLSLFVIADLTDPSSIPHELMSFIPILPSVVVQPIINEGKRPYSMFLDSFSHYPWVLPIHEYGTREQLITELSEKIILPAVAKAQEMRPTSLGL